MKTRNVIGISNESSAFWIVFWGTNGVSYSWALWRWDKPSGHFRGYTPFSGKNHIGGFISHENPTSEKERFLLPSFLLVKSYIFMPRLLVVHPHIIYIYIITLYHHVGYIFHYLSSYLPMFFGMANSYCWLDIPSVLYRTHSIPLVNPHWFLINSGRVQITTGCPQTWCECWLK